MDIKGKVAVVTGATGGLGWRICLKLAEKGARICMVYSRSQEKAEQNLAELEKTGTEAIITQADVTTQEGCASMLKAAADAFGGVDILILDAAYNESIPFTDLETMTPEKWEYILQFNLTSPFVAARQAAAYMKKRGGGRIVTISSVGGNIPSSSSIAYSVSKAGLQHLSRCLAVALAPDNILVNDVAPGLMEGTRMTGKLTDEIRDANIKLSVLKRAAGKDDVAAAVLMFVENDSITGQSLVVDSGRVFK